MSEERSEKETIFASGFETDSYDEIEDDGVTLADMSQLDDRGLSARWFGQRRGGPAASMSSSSSHSDPASPSASHQPTELLQGEERRTAIRGALAATLLIGLVYVAAAGLVILSLLWIWGAL